jgi:hypothetical protein
MKKIFIALLLILLPIGIYCSSILSSSTDVITHKTLTTSGTEYLVTIEAGTTSWIIQDRTGAAIKFTNVAGGTSGSDYMTIPSGGNWSETDRRLYDNQIWYFAGSVNGQVIEIKKCSN